MEYSVLNIDVDGVLCYESEPIIGIMTFGELNHRTGNIEEVDAIFYS